MCLGLLPLRRCGYSKAKQDPEEEKMHFHNGHSKLKKPKLILYMCVCGKFIQSLRYMYSGGFKQRSCLYEFVHPRRPTRMCVLPVQLTMFYTRSYSFNDKHMTWLHDSPVDRGHIKLWLFIGCDGLIYLATFLLSICWNQSRLSRKHQLWRSPMNCASVCGILPNWAIPWKKIL